MVYLSDKGEVIIDHLSPKDLLDTFRLLCKGKINPNQLLCNQFNEETNDGKKMDLYSDLLEEAINSIINLKNESELEGFLLGKQMSFLSGTIDGLDDFELITFLVIKDKGLDNV